MWLVRASAPSLAAENKRQLSLAKRQRLASETIAHLAWPNAEGFCDAISVISFREATSAGEDGRQWEQVLTLLGKKNAEGFVTPKVIIFNTATRHR